MSGITTHVLDTARGVPAAGVAVRLDRWSDRGWDEVGNGVTDADGRCRSLVAGDNAPPLGRYRLRFDTAAYFAARGTSAFFPEVAIVFEIATPSHHHVPLLLSPFGYSTYRGS